MPGHEPPQGPGRPRLRQRAAADALAILRYHRSGLYSLAVLVGLAAGAGAICFRLGIDAWAQLLTGSHARLPARQVAVCCPSQGAGSSCWYQWSRA